MPVSLEFDPITLACECLHRGGADFSELELNKLARAVIAQDAEIQRLKRELEESEACTMSIDDLGDIRPRHIIPAARISKRDTRCARCGGWGWVVLSGPAWKETSADTSTWCRCEIPEHPVSCRVDSRCQRPDGHSGYHEASGEVDGMSFRDEWSP